MLKRVLSITSFFSILISFKSYSEVRRYQYLIANEHPNGGAQKRASISITSLSPVANSAFNGSIKISPYYLLRTWKCPGLTNRKNICIPKKVFKN
jgi:hypothetical protein